MVVDAAGRVRLVGSVPLLHPEQQMLEEMLEGWRTSNCVAICSSLRSNSGSGWCGDSSTTSTSSRVR